MQINIYFRALSALFLFTWIACDQTRTDNAHTNQAIPPNKLTSVIPDSVSNNVSPVPTANIVWETELPYGTHSSPRPFYLEDSSAMLITFGDEEVPAGGIMALDIITGKINWHINTEHELFALPMPLTLRKNGTYPWVFGGRDGQLHAIDVLSGISIWRFQPFAAAGRADGIYNFFTGREFGDVNADGIIDYLVSNGGDSQRDRFESRPPGQLFVLSGADGTIIHRLPVPDKRETYCSPMLWSRMGEEWVIFGTGGETFPGSLWGVPAQSVKTGTLKDIRTLIYNTEAKGAIAPPAFADVDGDNVLDLIATPFDGRLVVLSGRTLTPLWEFTPTETNETQSSPAIGDFDGDGDLDIVYVVQHGTFPVWNASSLRAFDAASGALIWQHKTNGDLSAGSPLVADIDADGRDEILFVQATPTLFKAELKGQASISRLNVVDITENHIKTIATLAGFNAGTGWFGDADKDGQLDWFIPLKKDNNKGSLVRIKVVGVVPPRISWGGYLGTQHNGL